MKYFALVWLVGLVNCGNAQVIHKTFTSDDGTTMTVTQSHPLNIHMEPLPSFPLLYMEEPKSLNGSAYEDVLLVNKTHPIEGVLFMGGHLTSACAKKLLAFGELRELILSDCTIDRAALSIIGSLTNLEDYRHSPYHEEELAALRPLKKLRFLRIHGSKLTTPDVEWIGSLKNLESLELNYCECERGIFEKLKNPDLKHLEITFSNQLSSDELRAIGNLDLTYLKITKVKRPHSLRFIENLSHLRHLEISDDEASDADLAWIAELTELEILKLNTPKVTDSIVEDCGELNLRQLFLRSSSVTGTGFSSWERAATLENLYIRNSPFDDKGFAHLKGIRIRLLDLVETKVTLEGLKSADLSTIAILCVVGVPASPEFVTELSKKFPHLQIALYPR